MNKRRHAVDFFIEPLPHQRDYRVSLVFVSGARALIIQQEMVDAVDAALHLKRLEMPHPIAHSDRRELISNFEFMKGAA
jgi:hypothetical protein